MVLLMLLFTLTMISGCDSNKIETQTESEEISEIKTTGIRYLTLSSSIKQYSLFMSSVPGLPIEIAVNDNVPSKDISIKVKSTYGRIFMWINSQPIDNTASEIDLEYMDQTIYWSPVMNGEILEDKGIPILIEVIDKSNGNILEDELIYVDNSNRDGFYALSYENVNEKLYSEFIKNKNKIDNYESIIGNNIDINTIKFLKSQGIDDYKYILADLEFHPEIIPFEGILGGTMRWYANDSKFINSRWIIGYFEDGHVAGRAILRYIINADKTISWEIIDAYME